MPITAAGGALTREHQRQQAALRSYISKQLVQIWPMWSVDDIDATSPGFLSAAVRIMETGFDISASLGSAYYERFRLVEGAKGPAPDFRFEANLDAMRTSATVTAPVRTKQLIGRGVPPAKAKEQALSIFLGSATRHVSDGGRGQVLREVAEDDEAVGYARIAGGDACAFCAMLASRGPVYLSRSTAATSYDAGEFSTGDEVHDNCSCTVEPVMDRRRYKWNPLSREYRDLWDETMYDEDGNLVVHAGPGSGQPGQLAAGQNVPLQVYRGVLAEQRA